MTIEAWPFLVGRNRNLGYQTIVSAQFMTERGLSSLLAEAAGGDDTPQDTVVYRKILGTKAGNITLVFRVIKANAQDYNLGSEEVLRDRGGRVIHLIEGFVIRGRQSSLQITLEDLQKAHALVKKAYHDFWQENDQFTITSSQPFDLAITNSFSTPLRSSIPIKIVREAPLDLRFWKPWRIILAFVTLMILIPGLIEAYALTHVTAIEKFCYGLSNKNYTEAYMQLSNDVQSQSSHYKSDFESFFHASAYQVKECTYQKNNRSAVITIAYQDGVSAITSVTLANDGKIDTNIVPIQAFCYGLSNKNYTEAYMQLSNDIQSQSSHYKSDFESFFRANAYQVKTCTYQQNNRSAVITIAYQDGVSAITSVTLANDGKIDTNIIANLQRSGLPMNKIIATSSNHVT